MAEYVSGGAKRGGRAPAGVIGGAAPCSAHLLTGDGEGTGDPEVLSMSERRRGIFTQSV